MNSDEWRCFNGMQGARSAASALLSRLANIHKRISNGAGSSAIQSDHQATESERLACCCGSRPADRKRADYDDDADKSAAEVPLLWPPNLARPRANRAIMATRRSGRVQRIITIRFISGHSTTLNQFVSICAHKFCAFEPNFAKTLVASPRIDELFPVRAQYSIWLRSQSSRNRQRPKAILLSFPMSARLEPSRTEPNRAKWFGRSLYSVCSSSAFALCLMWQPRLRTPRALRAQSTFGSCDLLCNRDNIIIYSP